MPELSYFMVDVFTEKPLAGKPMVVVMNARGLAREQMQAIARGGIRRYHSSSSGS